MPTVTELYADFARRLRAVRIARDFSTGRDAALSLGVQENTYTTWERGAKAPKYWHLALIKKRWGVSLDYLLTGDEAAMPLALFQRIQKELDRPQNGQSGQLLRQ